jgi:hypothetical protein
MRPIRVAKIRFGKKKISLESGGSVGFSGDAQESMDLAAGEERRREIFRAEVVRLM